MHSAQTRPNYFWMGKTTALKPADNHSIIKGLFSILELGTPATYFIGRKGTSYVTLGNPNIIDNDESLLSFTQHVQKDDRICGMCGIRNWSRLARNAEILGYIFENNSNDENILEQYAMTVSMSFDRLNLNRVTVIHLAQDDRIENSLAKLGFTKEGVLRQYFYNRSKYHDAIMCSMLREEYDSKNNVICRRYLAIQ